MQVGVTIFVDKVRSRQLATYGVYTNYHALILKTQYSETTIIRTSITRTWIKATSIIWAWIKGTSIIRTLRLGPVLVCMHIYIR